MFTFLNSTVLFAAAAALIPLIIHLFSRRRVKVVEFSSLKHLKAMQRRQVRRLKVRQWILLLLRMLIILSLVMAFARPTLRSGAVGSHAAVAAVVLLDNSSSMDRYVADGHLFDLARQRTESLLETFGEGDQVALIPLDQTGGARQPLRLGTAAAALRQLESIQTGWSRAELEGALDQGRQILDGAASLNKEIYLIGDRQSNNLPAEPQLLESDARVVVMELPVQAPDNCGIIDVNLGGELILPGHPFELAATVRNSSSLDRDDLIASLWVDGERVAQTDLAVAAGDEALVRFRHQVNRTGFHTGRVELSDDVFIPDNSHYFSFRIPDQFNLLLVGEGAAVELAALALAPSESVNQYWSLKRVNDEQLSMVNLLEYDVIVFAGSEPPSASFKARLRTYLGRGKSVLIACGDIADAAAFNNAWAEYAAVTMEQPVPLRPSRAGYYSLGSVVRDHPIFSVFEFADNDLPDVKFYALPQVQAMPSAQVLARFSGDRPALIENRFESGRVLTFAGPLSPIYSDLAEHAFFVPLLSRAVEYLTAELSSFDVGLRVGDREVRHLDFSGAVTVPLDLHTPDSGRFSITPEEGAEGLSYYPEPLDMPGIYEVRYLGRPLDRVAVNLDAEEGDLAAADPDRLAAAIGAPDATVLGVDGDIGEAVAELRYGRELWQLFLWLAALLVLAEILIARSRPVEE